MSLLLYWSETWASHAVTKCNLNSFHICCQTNLLGITWRDKVPNVDILRLCGTVNLQTILKQHRLCYFGYVFCIDTDCLPQQTLYGKLANAECNRGHPRLHYTDACQCNLKLSETDAEWEMTASRCQLWRRKLHNGNVLYKRYQGEKYKKVRSRRKAACQTDSFLCQECRRQFMNCARLVAHSCMHQCMKTIC